MARIPETELARLKHDIALQRLAESAGITLKRHGADLVGLCPFHNDKTPSLVISPKTNLWHCLGACQTGGSVIDWVMKVEGISFRHAVELLQNDGFSSLAADTGSSAVAAKPVKHSTMQKLPTTLATNAEDDTLLVQVIDYYHQALKDSPEALAYLQKRGIGSADAIDHFKLGFANRTLGYRLPKANRKDGAAIRGQLQKIGLYRQSGHEHFTGSIIIPVIDERGHVKEVYGRKLLDNLRKGTPKHLYLPGPHQGVFNEAALSCSTEIILCESLIDALSFWCAGYKNVTASYGISGFTADHLTAFKHHKTERVLIAYDRDEAGNKAADKLAMHLMENGIDCYRIQFPKGMDANAYALSVQPASKSLGIVIRSAIWLGKGTSKEHAITTPLINDTPQSARKQDLFSAVDTQSKQVELPPLAASPQPDVPDADNEVEISDSEVVIKLEDRRYRLRGLNKNLGYDSLKINIMASNEHGMHIDSFDCYHSRPRASFIKQTALELGVNEDSIKADFGHVLLKCEALQEQNIKQSQIPKQNEIKLTEKQQQAALALLTSKNLLQQIQDDFKACGIVGEATNSLVAYLAAVSRKLDTPLAILIQSTSAAGKSALMDAVLRFVPDSDKHQYSAMTGQSLYYLGSTDLKHKVLAISEQEGASNASYALKLLQSEGQITIASTGKDSESGDLVTKQYKVEGPVMLFLTTTAIEIDEELLNRCLVLTVNEDRQQTQAIHQLQRKKRTLEGLIQKSTKQAILQQHQNAQRLLKPLAVVNPYAERLTFLNDQTRTRRDHEKYLTLIDSIALLHQYQREIKTVTHHDKPVEYVEVTLDDIEAANHLAHEVLGRTLDELPPQTRTLLTLIDKMVTEQCKQYTIKRSHFLFSRREIRRYTGWSDNQLKVHCYRLQEMEYLLVHTGGRGKTIQYELLYDGHHDKQQRQLMGLIDVKQLKQHYDKQKLDKNTQKCAPSLAQVAPKLAGCLGDKNNAKANDSKLSGTVNNNVLKNTYIKVNNTDASYRCPPLIATST